LRLRNAQTRPSLAKHLEGKCWELREESSTNIYCVIYAFFTGQRNSFAARFSEEDTEDATA